MPFPIRSEKRLGEILVELCLISPVQIHRMLKKQEAMNKSKGYKLRLGEMLLREKMIDEVALAKAVGEQYGIDFLNLSDVDISLEEMAGFPFELVESVPFVAIKRGTVDLTIAIYEEPHEDVYRVADASHSGDIIFVSSPKDQIDSLRSKILPSLKSGKAVSGFINLSGFNSRGELKPPKASESIDPESNPGELIMPLPQARELENDPYLSSGDALEGILPMPQAVVANAATEKIVDKRIGAINKLDAPSPGLPSTTPKFPPQPALTEPIAAGDGQISFDPLDLVPDGLAFANSFADAQSQSEIGFNNFPPQYPEEDEDLFSQGPANQTRSNIRVQPPAPVPIESPIQQLTPIASTKNTLPEGQTMDEQENMKNKKSSGSSKMNSILKDILISGISMRSTSISFCHSGNMVNVYSKGANSTVKLTEIERPDFGEILTYLEVLLQSSLNGMTTPVRKKVKLKLGTEAHLFQFLFAPTKPVSLNINILDHQATGHSLSSLSLSNKHVEAIKRALTEHHGLTIVSAPANSCLDKIGGAILNFLSLEERKVLYFGTEETRELTGMSQVTVGVEHTLPETAFSAATLKTFLDSNYDNIVSVAPLSEDALKRLVNIALSETNTTIFIESNDCLSSFMAVKKTGVSTSSLIEACKFIINVREVKGVCPFCKETFIITKEQLPPNLQTANQLINIKAYRGKGCKLCKNTGISGKTLVFETMEVDSEQIDIDMLTRTQKPLKKFLLESGLLQPLIKEARRSLMNGRITFDEFINLVSPR